MQNIELPSFDLPTHSTLLFPEKLPPIMQQQVIYQTSFQYPSEKQTLQLEVESEGLMEIEFKEEKDTSEEMNFSKDFLKFSRKMCNLMTSHLESKSEPLMSILNFSGGVTEKFFYPLGLPSPNLSDLITLQINCLHQLWRKYKETISYSKNKKICIVKSHDWNKIFNLQDFTAEIRDYLSTSQTKYSSIDLDLLFKHEHIIYSFCNILFYANLLFSYTMIQKDPSSKGDYLRTLSKIENFLVLMVNPELYKSYNHRSGKFALECCGKCKICRSKKISEKDFPLKLEKGRSKSELLKTLIKLYLNEFKETSENNIFNVFNVTMNYI